MIGRPVTSPVEAYAAGVRGWACAIPEGTVNVIGDSSGPNEQAMESRPALAVEHLAVREAYRIGRAVHFIGFVLDQEKQRLKTAQRVHRLLLEKSRQRQAADQPYTAEQLTDDFLDAFASRLSKDAAWLRDRILRYVDTEVAFRYPSDDLGGLRESDANSQRRAIAGYSHPKVEQLENDVLPFGPAFHVAGPLDDDLERSSWTTIQSRAVKNGTRFSRSSSTASIMYHWSMIPKRSPARNIYSSMPGPLCGSSASGSGSAIGKVSGKLCRRPALSGMCKPEKRLRLSPMPATMCLEVLYRAERPKRDASKI